MGFSVTMNLIENPLSDEKLSLKWDATVFFKTRKTNILMHPDASEINSSIPW